MVGRIENRTAIFPITELRYFKEADAIGVDVNILNRKAVKWCQEIRFDMWSGEKYLIKMSDFLTNAWEYPKFGTEKASSAVFTKKRVLCMDKVKELAKLNEKTEVEKLKELSLSL